MANEKVLTTGKTLQHIAHTVAKLEKAKSTHTTDMNVGKQIPTQKCSRRESNSPSHDIPVTSGMKHRFHQ